MSEEEKKQEMVESPSSEERRLSKGTEWTNGIDSLFEDFRKNFDSYMSPFVPMRSFLSRTRGFPIRAPLVDFMDRGDHFLLRAELPGFNKDKINVELNKDTLVLSAEMKRDEEEKDEGYLHRERTYSTCRRTINFPEEVNPDNVEAKMTDGILELKLMKKEPAPEERMRKIEL